MRIHRTYFLWAVVLVIIVIFLILKWMGKTHEGFVGAESGGCLVPMPPGYSGGGSPGSGGVVPSVFIQNGSFAGGQPIGGYNASLSVSNSPGNAVVQVQSPASSGSGYALQQGGAGTKYVADIAGIPQGQQLIATYWCAPDSNWTNTTDPVVEFVSSGKVIPTNNTLLTTKTVGDLTWYQVQMVFVSPAPTLTMYVGGQSGLTATSGTRYITGLALQPLVIQAPGFPSTKDLQLLLQGSGIDCSNLGTTWEDPTNNVHLTWAQQPTYNPLGYYATKGNTLMSYPPNVVSGQSLDLTGDFTIMLYAQGAGTAQDTSVPVALSIPGNNSTAFVASIPNYYGAIGVQIGDLTEQSKTTYTIPTGSKELYSFVYSSSAQTMTAYAGETVLETFSTAGEKMLPSATGSIAINPTGAWNANLYAVVVFSRALNTAEIQQIMTYFNITSSGVQGCDMNSIPGGGGGLPPPAEKKTTQIIIPANGMQIALYIPSTKLFLNSITGNIQAGISSFILESAASGQFYLKNPIGTQYLQATTEGAPVIMGDTQTPWTLNVSETNITLQNGSNYLAASGSTAVLSSNATDAIQFTPITPTVNTSLLKPESAWTASGGHVYLSPTTGECLYSLDNKVRPCIDPDAGNSWPLKAIKSTGSGIGAGLTYNYQLSDGKPGSEAQCLGESGKVPCSETDPAQLWTFASLGNNNYTLQNQNGACLYYDPTTLQSAASTSQCGAVDWNSSPQFTAAQLGQGSKGTLTAASVGGQALISDIAASGYEISLGPVSSALTFTFFYQTQSNGKNLYSITTTIPGASGWLVFTNNTSPILSHTMQGYIWDIQPAAGQKNGYIIQDATTGLYLTAGTNLVQPVLSGSPTIWTISQ